MFRTVCIFVIHAYSMNSNVQAFPLLYLVLTHLKKARQYTLLTELKAHLFFTTSFRVSHWNPQIRVNGELLGRYRLQQTYL